LDDVFSILYVLKLPKSRPNCLKAARQEMIFMENRLVVVRFLQILENCLKPAR